MRFRIDWRVERNPALWRLRTYPETLLEDAGSEYLPAPARSIPPPEPRKEIMPKQALSLVDQRTQAASEIAIQDGAIRAMDLRQIKTGPEDFGLMTYDPGIHEHGVLPKRHHLHRWRQGHPALSRISHRAAGRELHLPGGGLSAAVRRTAHRGRNSRNGWTTITHHTMLHETTKKFLEGFRYNAHPMGMLISTVAALSTVYPGVPARARPGDARGCRSSA